MFTYDPNLSGGAETPWLIPMLLPVFIGGISFGVMFITGTISLVKKDTSKIKMPLGVTVLKCVISVVLLCILIVVFFIGIRKGNIGYQKPNYNGQQLFDAVNEYRQTKGVPILILDPVLCDNLVERWLAIKNPDNGHKGYEEWLKAEGISDNQKYGQIGELYVTGTETPQKAINFWQGSPGHRSTLEMKEMNYGCAYANEGIGVVIMATDKVIKK